MINQAFSYIKHLKDATGVSRIKDVKLRSLLAIILDEEKGYYAFLSLSLLKKKMLKDKREIAVLDLGAGSKKLKDSKRRIKDIAKLSVKKSKYAEVLFRLVEVNQISKVIEVGTSLGVTTGFLALANPKGTVVTLEGCPETLKIAKENFQQLNLKNVRTIEGNFDSTLPQVLSNHPDAGLIFIDGNHTKKATLAYFEQGLMLGNEDLIIVFDDIHWSKDMEEAWDVIKNHKSVQATVDIYEMGIVFLNVTYLKEDYMIRF